MSKYEIDCNDKGEWFVFDNEAMYCCAGPFSEDDAISEKARLENL